MTDIPNDFKIMLRDLMGHEASLLIKALEQPPVTSVRLNLRKPGAEFPDAEPVPWCKSGFYLNERPEFIFDPLLHAGAYYVQDASSMIYETVIEKLLPLLHNQNGHNSNTIRMLDLCAAPGGKTTAMINALPEGSEVIANEFSTKRVGALRENLEKWGYRNVIVTNKDTSFYAQQKEDFDIVAVDAPCSGEGMMRKEDVARSQWSPQLIEQCATLQKKILSNAEKAIKPGGFLIYSTCTFNRCENEDNAQFIADELGMEPIDLNLPKEWNIARGIETGLPIYRFLPHRTKGEGLFLAVFRKPGEWLPSKKRLISSNLEFPSDNYPRVDVDKDTAIAYLRRESIVLPPEAPKGMVIITYKSLPLGPAKNIGSRANNLYPKNRRILKR